MYGASQGTHEAPTPVGRDPIRHPQSVPPQQDCLTKPREQPYFAPSGRLGAALGFPKVWRAANFYGPRPQGPAENPDCRAGGGGRPPGATPSHLRPFTPCGPSRNRGLPSTGPGWASGRTGRHANWRTGRHANGHTGRLANRQTCKRARAFAGGALLSDPVALPRGPAYAPQAACSLPSAKRAYRAGKASSCLPMACRAA